MYGVRERYGHAAQAGGKKRERKQTRGPGACVLYLEMYRVHHGAKDGPSGTGIGAGIRVEEEGALRGAVGLELLLERGCVQCGVGVGVGGWEREGVNVHACMNVRARLWGGMAPTHSRGTAWRGWARFGVTRGDVYSVWGCGIESE